MKIDLKIKNAKKMESIFSVYTLQETTKWHACRVKQDGSTRINNATEHECSLGFKSAEHGTG